MTDTDPDEWDDALAENQQGPGTLYPNAEDWLIHHLSQVINRQLEGPTTWCAHWWAHPEAISRIEALWRAWENLRHDPVFGMAIWWRDHADHHLPILMSRDTGPFAACTPTRHTEDLHPLPAEPAPPGWWGSRNE